MDLTIDLSKTGLSMLFKPYEELIIRRLWELRSIPSETYPVSKEWIMSSREAWEYANENLPAGESISRASVINFLNAMVEERVLDYEETTGKGGHRALYYAKQSESEFLTLVMKEAAFQMQEGTGQTHILEPFLDYLKGVNRYAVEKGDWEGFITKFLK